MICLPCTRPEHRPEDCKYDNCPCQHRKGQWEDLYSISRDEEDNG